MGSGILEGFTDYHSHILPGVDDGIRTLGESLDTLDCLEKLGVKSIWLTPHVMEDIPNTSEKLRERFQLSSDIGVTIPVVPMIEMPPRMPRREL